MRLLGNISSEQAQQEAEVYLRASELIRRMKKLRGVLSAEEVSTLRRQALDGDVSGARAILDRLLRERL